MCSHALSSVLFGRLFATQTVSQTRHWTERQLSSYIRFNIQARKSEYKKRKLKDSTTKYLHPPKSIHIQKKQCGCSQQLPINKYSIRWSNQPIQTNGSAKFLQITSGEQPTSLILHMRTGINDVSTNLSFSHNTYYILIRDFKLLHFTKYIF